MAEADYYKLLGIERGAGKMEIKRAYYSKVKIYTPEKDPEAFKKIRAAYEFLTDERKRADYDKYAELSNGNSNIAQEAKRLLYNNDYKEAIRILESHKKDDAMALLLAEAYLENGNTGLAIKLLEGLLKRNEEEPDIYLLLEKAYLLRGFSLKAESIFDKVMRKFPNNPAVLCRRVRLFLRHGMVLPLNLLDSLEPISESIAYHDIEIFPPLVSHASRYDRFDLVQTFYSSYIKGLESAKVLEPSVYEDMLYMTGDLICIRECLSSGKQALAYLKKHALGKEEHNEVLQKIEDVICLREMEERDELFPPVIQLTVVLIISSSIESPKLAQFFWEYQLVKYVEAANESLVKLRDEYPRFFELNKTFYLMLMNRKKYKGLKTRYEKQWITKSRQYPEFFDEINGLDEFDALEPFKDIKEVFRSDLASMPRREQKALEDLIEMVGARMDLGEKPMDSFLEMLELDFDESGFGEPDFDEMFGEPVDKPYVRTERKVGRNEPCPCGSDKKYKQCCGRSRVVNG